MQTRVLGRTGIPVSAIGFGAWGIGGGWGRQDDDEAVRALEAALSEGVTFYDTAMGYGNGHSERLLGRAFKDRRKQVVIATKIAPKIMKWPALESDPAAGSFPGVWIRECTARSLERLQTDYLDVQQFHCWADAWLEQQDTWLPAVADLKRQGLIKAFGVSVNDWDPYNAVRLVQSGLVDTIQVIYNPFEQRPAEKLLPACLKHGVGVIVRVPFEEGLLTGKFRPGHVFEEGDWRARWMTPERLQEAESHVRQLEALCNSNFADLPTLSLAFILGHPAVSTVIPGMRSVAHVRTNTAVAALPAMERNLRRKVESCAWYHGWPYPWRRADA